MWAVTADFCFGEVVVFNDTRNHATGLYRDLRGQAVAISPDSSSAIFVEEHINGGYIRTRTLDTFDQVTQFSDRVAVS